MSSERGPFHAVPDQHWNDWRWQQANRIRTAAQLAELIELSADERQAIARCDGPLPLGITPYYLSLIDPNDPEDPIRRQAVPRMAEHNATGQESRDPLAEEQHSPVAGLIHRYPDRAVLYTTHNCAVYCRFCFRKRLVGDPQTAPSQEQLAAAIAYLREHSEIRDLLVSGGDPLSLSDERIDELLRKLRTIAHLETIRIATRNPVTLPQRITPALARLLGKHHPIFINTHFNHPRECTEEAAQALATLADAGCVLGNQMVLLAGINDDAATVKQLNHWLLANRCRPYYIFQCDTAVGNNQFRTPVERGLEIVAQLHGWTSGLAVPHYVVDLPDGGGKVPLLPNWVASREGKQWLFKTFEGRLVRYDDP